MAPRTKYARNGEISIAYQVVGDGPVDLVLGPGFVSHVEYAWEEPKHAYYYRRLSAFSRLIVYDKRGTGLSDRAVGIATLAERVDGVRAVMDAAGSERAVLMGFSESGPLHCLFAATYPERVSALVLCGAYASEVRKPDFPWERTAEQFFADLDERASTIHETWGSDADAEGFVRMMAPSAADDPAFCAWFSTFL